MTILSEFNELIDVVKKLRSPEGCPWDREQTLESLTPHIIEEAYELVDAIQTGVTTDIQEELGDVLLHVVMLSNMAEEDGHFSLLNVIQTITEKMIRRHPHVFGDVEVNSVDEVWKNWEAIKKQEKSGSIFTSIPASLPALMQAEKIQKKASRVGFDWDDKVKPFEKVKEEVAEIGEVLAQPNPDIKELEEEIGDALFAIVNVARKWDIDPEAALRAGNTKFKRRFAEMETVADQNGTPMSQLSLDELNELWEQAKLSKPLVN